MASASTALAPPAATVTSRGVSHALVRAVSALVYVAGLEFVYRTRIAPVFGYLKFDYRTPTTTAFVVSTVAVVVLAAALPRRLRRPSDLILWALFIVVVAPSITVPQYTSVLDPGQAVLVSSTVALSFLGVVFGVRGRTLEIVPTVQASTTSFWATLLVITGAVYLYVAVKIGLNPQFVSLAEVYDVRSDYKAQLVDAPLLAYLVPWQGNVINPIFVAKGIYSRRPLVLAVGLAGQLLLYSVNGYKTLLFSTPAMVALSLLFRRRQTSSGQSLLVGAIALTATAALLDRIFNTITPTSLFVRRFLVFPGFLTAVYVKVFTELPQTHLTQSAWLSFGDYPYNVAPGQVVGGAFFQRPGTNANANLFADGFMNFGYLGILGAGVALVVVLRVIDSASRGLPVVLSGLLFFMSAITLANSGILTTTLTHGLGLAVVMACCMPRTGWSIEERRQSRSYPATSVAASRSQP